MQLIKSTSPQTRCHSRMFVVRAIHFAFFHPLPGQDGYGATERACHPADCYHAGPHGVDQGAVLLGTGAYAVPHEMHLPPYDGMLEGNAFLLGDNPQ